MADLDKLMEADVTDVETNTFVVLIPRHTAYMEVTYLMIDPHTRTILPKAKSIKWPRLTDFMDFRFCVLKNVIYIIGGREKSSGKCVRQTLKYDPFVGRWRDCANLKTARSRHTATVLDGKIYVVVSQHVVDMVVKIPPCKPSTCGKKYWPLSHIQSLWPQPAITEVGGGENSTGELLDTCEYYEPLMDEWHRAEKLMSPRKDHACVVKDDKLYLSGGMSKTEGANDNIWVFKKCWPSRAKPEEYFYDWFPFKDAHQRTMSHRLTNHTMVISRGKMFFLAGVKKNIQDLGFRRESIAVQQLPTATKKKKKTKQFVTHKAIEAYKLPSRFSRDIYLAELEKTQRSSTEKVTQWNTGNTNTNSQLWSEAKPEKRRWITQLPPSPIARCSAASAVVGNKIYLLGGHTIEDESTSVNTVQYYHTKKQKWFPAFSLGDKDFRDVDCVVITVPVTNKDFQSVKYGDCKWVLW